MTDREAISVLECAEFGNTTVDKPMLTEEEERLYEARDVAISALQERIDRERGCECCNQHNAAELGEKVYSQSVSYYIVGDGYPHREKHRFCPLCGRKLKGAQDESICM